ncbi:TadE/TadG family type IV pilus assembly protein [Haloechinothrix halophila]|uniref:TadE/TadG family type IV pilus assembly protein n=1 Tax=Haloechinothrix halophila TaxID=1069073 RepID=UPI0004225C5B|nr:TadE/TadG family type IV pilus assembly protein [Haloechinothrix halophila]
MSCRECREGGSVSVQLAILVPVVLLVGLLVVAAGRLHAAQQALDHAAAAAARDASLARTASAATVAATSTANRMLAQRNIRCATSSVTVDASEFGARPGTLGLVRVTVRCTVPLADLALPFGGGKQLAATFASPLDPFRTGGS